jgi:hypothetical protein
MNASTKQSTLSDSEVASRAVVAANAIGSTEIEGLSVSADLRSDLNAWCHGKISVSAVIEKAKARHSRA